MNHSSGRIIPAEEVVDVARWEMEQLNQASEEKSNVTSEHDTLLEDLDHSSETQTLEYQNFIDEDFTHQVVIPESINTDDVSENDQETITHEAILSAQQQHDDGYADGYEKGIASAKAEVERLNNIINDIEGISSCFETSLASKVLELALEVARQVLRHELHIDRLAILPLVRDAFDQMTGTETNRQLFMHSSDIELVKAHMNDELRLNNWKIIEDNTIQPGGCRICTQQSEIDATIENRWKRTLSVLGVNQAWATQDEPGKE